MARDAPGHPTGDAQITVPIVPRPLAAPGGPPRAGQRLGRFTLTRRLGQGGMGEVWAAHDPALDREVAIKQLHVGAHRVDDDLRARLRREAQAMARLTHPGVVRVHELASDGDVVFCAMELIDGVTLRDWLAQPRAWRAVLEVLLAAGRGIAAAHRAGIVHRDVKPDNLLIASDGRTLVADFGVAKLADADAEARGPAVAEAGPSPATALRTHTGTLLGTPAYMAPEQLAAGGADALSDQFAFCVTAYEALFGVRPYPGTTIEALAAAVRRGPAAPADRRGAPRRVVRCILRGLSADRAARWPDLEALLAALARAGRAPRRRTLAIGLAAAALALGGAWRACAVAPTGGDRDPGGVAAQRIARAWRPERAADLAAAFARAGDPAAASRAAIVSRALDRHRDAWIAIQDARGAAHARGAIAFDRLAQERACLDRVADELAAFVAIALAAAGPDDGERAARGVYGLTAPAACADPAHLAMVTAATSGTTDAPAGSAAIAAAAARLRATLLAGRPADAVALARQLLADAPPTQPRLLAGLELLLATAERDAADYPASEAALRRAIAIAAAARDDHQVATAWIRLVELVAVHAQRRAEAAALELAARAAVAQAGGDPEQRAQLAMTLGSLAYVQGQNAIARDRFGEAQGSFVAARGAADPQAAEAEVSRAMVEVALGEHGDGTRHARHALDALHALGRDDDPLAARALQVLSKSARLRSDLAGAADFAGRAVEIFARIMGPDHPRTAYARCDLGRALAPLRRFAEAIAAMQRCEASLLRVYPASHSDVTLTRLELGGVLEQAGQIDEAERVDRAAVAAMRSALPADHPDLAWGLAELARVVAHRDPAAAVPLYDEAMRIDTARPDRDAEGDRSTLEEIARTGLSAGQPAWALGWFRRLPAAARELATLERTLQRAAAR